MSRRGLVIRALVSIILGVMTTVGVAWGLAMLQTWGDPIGGQEVMAPQGSDLKTVDVQQVWQSGVVMRNVMAGSEPDEGGGNLMLPWTAGIRVGLKREEVDMSWGLARRALVKGEQVFGGEEARGWPCVALYSMSMRLTDPPSRRGGVRVRKDPQGLDDRFLPLVPIWRGFAIDSTLYGSAWMVVLTVPGVLRGAIRKRRGRCPQCGYDLKRDFDAGCSECGWRKAEVRAIHSGHG